jgi:hypothetical protein
MDLRAAALLFAAAMWGVAATAWFIADRVVVGFVAVVLALALLVFAVTLLARR